MTDNEILMFAIPIKVLHDHYKFGTTKRVPELFDYIKQYYAEYQAGTTTLENYKDFMFQITGEKM